MHTGSTIDTVRLSSLLANLHEITRLQLSLHDITGRELYSVYSRSTFCDLICNTSSGYYRCLACDRRSIEALLRNPEKTVEFRCHAGLIDAAIPVTERGQVIAVIMFGQLLDDLPLHQQWEKTSALCAWHSQPEALRAAFASLPRLTRAQIRACYEIINACVSEVRLLELLRAPSHQTDAQRLAAYLNANYALPLTLSTIAHALNISKSKLCTLAFQIEPGQTLTTLLARRRIQEAQRLLNDRDAVIRDVAEAVGIPDYNYFAKVFRRFTGVTPSQYRRSNAK